MYDMATNESNNLQNNYEYGNSDILASFDTEYQETEFTNRGFDYAEATSTVDYQLASDNRNVSTGLYQEPRYEVAD